MKIALLPFLLILLSITGPVKAQIQFEQQLPNYVFPFSTSQDGTWYVESFNDPVVSVYRSDFSLYKDMQIPIFEGCYTAYIFFLSDRLFNSDDKLEYILYRCTLTNTMEGLLVNEDGDILYDFGDVETSMLPFVTQSPGLNPVMGIYIWNTQLQRPSTDMYTLPGIYLPVKETEGATVLRYPSPNPANDLIEIPYSITGSADPLLTIHNTSGALVEKRILDRNQNKLLLNVSNLPAGTYIYTYGAESGKFIVR